MTVLYWLMVLVAVTGIGLYLRHHPDLIGHVRAIPPGTAIPLFLMSVAVLGVNGLYLRIFAKKFGMNLQIKEWFGLAAVTAMGNYLTPFSGGLVARAAYLKHRHDFPYAHFLAMLAANYLIAFTVISIIGIVSMLTLAGTEHYSWMVLLFFLAALMSVVMASSFPSITTARRNRLFCMAQSALEGLAVIRRDRVLLGKLVALTLLNITIGALFFSVVFGSMGLSVPFRTALLIYLLSSFTILIQVTPGNLGVQEAAASVAAGILGAGADMGLLASLIIRAVTILTAFTLGPVFSCLLSKELIAARDVSRSDGREAP